MKLDDKIRNRRISYLLKREQSTDFELALLYYILATRRTSEDKITDACRKSVQWLQTAGFQVVDNIKYLTPAEKLESIEKIIVGNRAILLERQASVAARHPDL